MFNYLSPAENSLHRFSSFQGWYEKISLLLHFPLYQEYGILEASFYFFLILKPNLFLKEWMMAFSQHFVIVFCLFRLRWVFKQFQISSNFFSLVLISELLSNSVTASYDIWVHLWVTFLEIGLWLLYLMDTHVSAHSFYYLHTWIMFHLGRHAINIPSEAWGAPMSLSSHLEEHESQPCLRLLAFSSELPHQLTLCNELPAFLKNFSTWF